MILAAVLGLAASQAIPPVEPQPGLQTRVTLEIRLKGAPTATNPSPTVRLYTWNLKSADSNPLIYVQPCWNTKSACPQVVAATVRVFLNAWGTKLNVTRFVLCNASECMLPAFAPLQAKPGQGYRFSYDRIKGQWTDTPSVVTAP